MTRRRTFLSLAAASAVALLTATATASGAFATETAASGVGISGLTWPGVPICATGSVVAAEPTTTVPIYTPLIVRIKPCTGTDLADVVRGRWGLALFFSGGAYIGGNQIQRFPSDGAEAKAQALSFPDGRLEVSGFGTAQAVCLVTEPAVRLACASLSASPIGAAPRIVATPLPIDDKLVNRTVQVASEYVANPVCAACV